MIFEWLALGWMLVKRSPRLESSISLLQPKLSGKAEIESVVDPEDSLATFHGRQRTRRM